MKLKLKQSIKVWFQINVMSLFYFSYSSKDKNVVDLKSRLTFKSQGTPIAELKREPKSTLTNTENNPTSTVIITAGDDLTATTVLVNALKKQSITPTKIWILCHTNKQKAFHDHSELADMVMVTNVNFLGWDKVALTQLVTTEHVVWIESYMQPAPNWLAECITQLEANEGIFGANGVIYSSDEKPTMTKFGWDGIGLTAEQARTQAVDFAEDAVFFTKGLFNKVSAQLLALKDYQSSPNVMFSSIARSQCKVNTFVLPFNDLNKTAQSTDKHYSLTLSRNAFSFHDYQTKIHALAQLKSELALVASSVDSSLEETTALEKIINTAERRDFKEELFFFLDKIITHENFSIVRFGDGEMKIVKGEHIKTSRFFYTPGDSKHEHNRAVLNNSLSFNNPQYFVGYPGRCCVGDHYADSIIELSGLPEEQLTWASVFINANYEDFLDVTIPALQQRTVNLICFEKSVLKHLPFTINKRFNVGMNAWADDLETILPAMEAYIESENVKDEVFVFCSGILSNMLIYKLTEKYPDNTYLDVGSVFDVYLSLGKTRRYLKGNEKQVQHSCTW